MKQQGSHSVKRGVHSESEHTKDSYSGPSTVVCGCAATAHQDTLKSLRAVRCTHKHTQVATATCSHVRLRQVRSTRTSCLTSRPVARLTEPGEVAPYCQIGAYGPGLVLRDPVDAGVTELSWLSMSTWFRER